MLTTHDLTLAITDEAAAAWWRIRYTGTVGRIIKSGRINKSGTPLYDTNWHPASAFICLIYRDMGLSVAEIGRRISKSHHAITDLFARVDFFERQLNI